MHLKRVCISNYRRLKDVIVSFQKDITIFVGANNSGKTSAAFAIDTFANADKSKLNLYDFSVDCRGAFDAVGAMSEPISPSAFPRITVDFWFQVAPNDLHRVLPLLPNLDWAGSLVRIRVEFSPTNPAELIERFREAHATATAHVDKKEPSPAPARGEPTSTTSPELPRDTRYHPWPTSLSDFLKERLSEEYGFNYFVLDEANVHSDGRLKEGYVPLRVAGDVNNGKRLLKSLIQVDCLHAQRHLADSDSGGRSEDLSQSLSRYYRELRKVGHDYEAMDALFVAEARLNKHLEGVFAPTMDRLKKVGYPNAGSPALRVLTALSPAAIFNDSQNTQVHYALDESEPDNPATLMPDRYNGLGFKNLIYMVIQLLHLQERWKRVPEERPLMHLIFIEEPEAHMHTQLQQTFIRQVLSLVESDDPDNFSVQLVATTHSPHILHEAGFDQIRYFRRRPSGHSSQVLDLSTFKGERDKSRDFLQRYMKLTHCDLFFADAAILVEGNVERLLLPLMIPRAAPTLTSVYVSLIEINGNFAYRFRELFEFLGITALVITDLDSVKAKTADELKEEAEEEDDEPEAGSEEASDTAEHLTPSARRGLTSCPANEPDAVTCNQTLITWLPGKRRIAELMACAPADRTKDDTGDGRGRVRVVYQTACEVKWREQSITVTARTLEEAFAYQNLVWCQQLPQRPLSLRVRKSDELSATDLVGKIYKKVNGRNFKKTDFAIALLAHESNDWAIPSYIDEGLSWLAEQVGHPVAPRSPKTEDPS